MSKTDMVLEGRITLLFSNNGLEIEIMDNGSRTTFVRAALSPEQVVQAMSRLANTECSLVVSRGALERVGTVAEHKKFEFKIGNSVDWRDKKDEAIKLAKLECPEGWIPDLYFSSQDSFFTKDGEQWARTTIRRWV